MPIVLKRVAMSAMSGEPVGMHALRRFTNSSLIVTRPPVRPTMAAFFAQEEAAVTASETDSGAALRLENQKLRAALKAAQKSIQETAAASSPLKAGAKGASSSSQAAAPFSARLDEDEESCMEDPEDSDEDDFLGGLMSVPMTPHVKPKQKPSRLKKVAIAATGGGGGHGQPVLPPGEDPQVVQLRLMYEMLKLLQERRGGGTGDTGDLDAPDGQELDGVRVLRTLSRMRALKAQLRTEPDKIYRDYRQRWEEDLGASGKSWKWIDVNQKINFGKFNSMRRVHAMLCHILEADVAAEALTDHLYVRALMIQCLKALHEFAQQGDWRTAWPLTHMPDPISHNPLGGSELEMGCVLAVLKTKDDLKARSKAARSRTALESVSDDEEEKPGADPKKKAGPKKKAEKGQ